MEARFRGTLIIPALQAHEAGRPPPVLEDATKSVLDACASVSVDPRDTEDNVVSVLNFFAEHGESIRARGVADLKAIIPREARPWEKPAHAAPEPVLDQVAELRFGRALWRLTRLELAEMTAEDVNFAYQWMVALLDGTLAALPCAPNSCPRCPPVLHNSCQGPPDCDDGAQRSESRPQPLRARPGRDEARGGGSGLLRAHQLEQRRERAR